MVLNKGFGAHYASETHCFSASKVGSFDPQNLANTAWAFTTSGRWDVSLFEELASVMEPRVSEFNQQNLVNTV